MKGIKKMIFERKATGAVTCAGKLSLMLKFAWEEIGSAMMKEIKDKAMVSIFAE